MDRKNASASKAEKHALEDFKRVFSQDRTALPCENCGAPVSFHGSDYPAHLLDGKRLCADCFDKMMETAVFTCVDCGRTFPKSTGKDDRCPECWKKHMASLRQRGKAFYEILESGLNECGFSVTPVVENRLDEYGMPLSNVLQDYAEGAIPLRKDDRGFYNGDERGVYAVQCMDAVVTIPADGIGLRFLTPSADSSFMKSLGEIRCDIAAIAGNAQALFLLRTDGRITSLPAGVADFTAPDIIAKTHELLDRFSQEDRERLEHMVRKSEFAMDSQPYDDVPAAFTDGIVRRFLDSVITRSDITEEQVAVSPHRVEINGEYCETEWRALDDGFYREHLYHLCLTVECIARRKAIELAVENASSYLRQDRNAPRYPKLRAESERYYELGYEKIIAQRPFGMEGIVLVTEETWPLDEAEL